MKKDKVKKYRKRDLTVYIVLRLLVIITIVVINIR